MKGKVISLILTGVFCLTTVLPVFAITSNVPSSVTDLEKKPIKSFTPQKIETNTPQKNEITSNTITPLSITGYWNSICNFDETWPGQHYASAISESYTDSTKSTRWPIDRIYAKVRVINYSGTLIGSAENEQKYSSVASTTSVPDSLVTDDHAISNHAFEMSGYQSWYPENYNSGGWGT